MNYATYLILTLASFLLSKLALRLFNPSDSEGSNLLVVGALAVAIFAVLLFACKAVSKQLRAKK